MGGRRSKSISHVFGVSKDLRSAKFKLTRALNKKANAEEIASSAVKLVSESVNSPDYLATASRFMDFVTKKVSKEKISLGLEEGKKFVNNLWTDTKKKENLQVPREIDEAIVTSIVDRIRRKEK